MFTMCAGMHVPGVDISPSHSRKARTKLAFLELRLDPYGTRDAV